MRKFTIFAVSGVVLLLGIYIAASGQIPMAQQKKILQSSSTLKTDDLSSSANSENPDLQGYINNSKTTNDSNTVQQNKSAKNTQSNTNLKSNSKQKSRDEKSEDTASASTINTSRLPISASTVRGKAEALTGVKIEAEDYLKAGSIIIKKFSTAEIKYFFTVAKKDLFANTSVEELEKIRKIVFSKLSSEDIAVLRTIGQKYGKDMSIINPDINVDEEKKKE